MSYHNTTQTTGEALREYEKKAMTQEDKVLDWFNKTTHGWTPSQIKKYVLRDSPVTSARRAITNLTDASKLVKTNRQINGPYGRPEFIWELKTKQLDLPL